MTLVARAALALTSIVAALLVHERLCEWRSVVYAEADTAAHRERVLVSFRRERHADGNAGAWDRADAMLRAYDRDWLACHRLLRGDPPPGSPLAVCLAARPYKIAGATAEAVSRAACEIELHGELPERAALAACLRERGHAEAPVPHWAFERLGPRFTGPYVEESALFAEKMLATPARDRALAIAAGLVLPALVLAVVLVRASGAARAAAAPLAERV